jgi:hypothetical protein
VRNIRLENLLVRDGQLAAPVVDAFHREGVLGTWVPCTLRGGLELGPLPSRDVLEQVSYADASAGWVLMAACLATGTGGAYLGDEAVAELFGKERLPVIAGQGTRPGTATPVAGGSGDRIGASRRQARHASTRSAWCGHGEARIFVLPVGQATLMTTGTYAARHRQNRLPHRRRVHARRRSPPGHDRDARRGGRLCLASSVWRSCVTRPGRRHGRRILNELAPGAGRYRPQRQLAGEAFHEQCAKAEGKPGRPEPCPRSVGRRERRSTPARRSPRQHTLLRLRSPTSPGRAT